MRKSYQRIAVLMLMQVLLSINAAFAQSGASTAEVAVTLDVISKGSTDYYREKQEGYFVTAAVTNIQDTAVSFVIMSCSWSRDNWVSDNQSISISDRGCDGNSPTRITLKPGQTIHFYGFIQDRDQKLKDKKFRFAFLYYTNFTDLIGFYQQNKSEQKGKKIWSNEVKLEDNLFNYRIGK